MIKAILVSWGPHQVPHILHSSAQTPLLLGLSARNAEGEGRSLGRLAVIAVYKHAALRSGRFPAARYLRVSECDLHASFASLPLQRATLGMLNQAIALPHLCVGRVLLLPPLVYIACSETAPARHGMCAWVT